VNIDTNTGTPHPSRALRVPTSPTKGRGDLSADGISSPICGRSHNYQLVNTLFIKGSLPTTYLKLR